MDFQSDWGKYWVEHKYGKNLTGASLAHLNNGEDTDAMSRATKCVFSCTGLSLDLPGRGFGNRHRQELHVMDRPPSVKCDLEYSPVSLPTHRISSVALTREMSDG